MRECIYCNRLKLISKSHIIPECLGGKVKLLERVCKDCNDFLGRTIEAKMCKDFSFYRYLAKIRTKKGKDTTTPAELQVMGKKVRVHIGEGGIPRFVPPIIETRYNKKRYFIVAESPEKLEKYAKRFKEMGIQFEFDSAHPLGVNLIFSAETRYLCSDDYLRVATKIAFEYLCFEYPPHAISSGYEKVKQFIKLGKCEGEKPAFLIYEKSLIEKMLYLPFPLHGILLFQYERIIGSIVSIFGLFYYFVLLKDDNRILQNWVKFVYFNPATGELRTPLINKGYSLERLLRIITMARRDPDLEIKAREYSRDKINKFLGIINS